MDAALLLLTDSRLPAGGHAHSGGAEEAVRTGAITGPDDLARFLRGRLATAGLVAAALAAAACELGTATPYVTPAQRPVTTTGTGPHSTTPAPQPGTNAGTETDEAVRQWERPWQQLWERLDAEADARIASPAQREAGRAQGRLLVRTARRIWPSAALDTLARAVPDGAHHPVALGAVAAAAGCDSRQAALAAAYNSLTGPATATVRLLGLDPVTVHRLLADLAPALNDTAHQACASLMDTMLVNPALMGAEPTGFSDVDPRTDETRWAALPAHAAPALDLLAERHRTNEMKLFVS